MLCQSEARSFFRVSHAGAGSQSFGLSLTAFPGMQGRELEGKRGPYGIPGMQGEDLNHCAIAPGPKILIFNCQPEVT